jgi:hypothetical protein
MGRFRIELIRQVEPAEGTTWRNYLAFPLNRTKREHRRIESPESESDSGTYPALYRY